MSLSPLNAQVIAIVFHKGTDIAVGSFAQSQVLGHASTGLFLRDALIMVSTHARFRFLPRKQTLAFFSPMRMTDAAALPGASRQRMNYPFRTTPFFVETRG